MQTNPLLELKRLGQRVWLDDIGRRMLADGSLASLIEDDGLAGLTSNPAIFASSIMGEARYAEDLRGLPPDLTSVDMYERLAIADLRVAADLFRPQYVASQGMDGYVSLEVSPHLAYDTQESIDEALRLWREVDRPNVMIKIPGTEPGLDAIRELIAAGVNVNVTLLFSSARYLAVSEAYWEGLEARLRRGHPVDRVASVASFFLSRIDTHVDQLIDELVLQGQPAARSLRGKAAVASACGAYDLYCERIASDHWQSLAARGAHPQLLLWASTSTKDATYSPIKYIEELVAVDTVTTMPLETLTAYRRLGRPELRLQHHIAQASDVREALERLGIDLDDVATQLEREGLRKFVEPFERLQSWLEERRAGP